MKQIVRYRTIDSLRGLAVLLMVMVHAAATWNPFFSAQSSILAYTVAGLGGLAAPLFVTIFWMGFGEVSSLTKIKFYQGDYTLIVASNSESFITPFV